MSGYTYIAVMGVWCGGVVWWGVAVYLPLPVGATDRVMLFFIPPETPKPQ